MTVLFVLGPLLLQAQGASPLPLTIDKPSQRQLDEIVMRQADADEHPAVYAAVSMNGRIFAASAGGRKRLTGEAKASIDDRLMIGSISKGVTATVITALVGQGKLRWGLTVREALPEFAAKFPHHPALEADFRDLLSHRSGLPRGDEHKFVDKPAAEWRLRYSEAMFAKPAAAPFRSKEGFYSAGATVAALMAERVLGKSFETLCQETLFKPLGMTTFGWGKPWELYENQPMGMKMLDGKRVHPEKSWNEYIKHDPSGGMHCTIIDLCRYATVQAVGTKRSLSGLSRTALGQSQGYFSPTPGSGGGNTGLGDYSLVYVDVQRGYAVACVALLDAAQGGQAKAEAVVNDVKKLLDGG